jgi:hypothetical protein
LVTGKNTKIAKLRLRNIHLSHEWGRASPASYLTARKIKWHEVIAQELNWDFQDTSTHGPMKIAKPRYRNFLPLKEVGKKFEI